jgi:hypothetical protein
MSALLPFLAHPMLDYVIGCIGFLGPAQPLMNIFDKMDTLSLSFQKCIV